MKERPILFSAPMVRAILNHKKRQTRRMNGLDAINGEPGRYAFDGMQVIDGVLYACFTDMQTQNPVQIKCPYGQKGDQLWVREAWKAEAVYDDTKPRDIPADACMVFYPANNEWSDYDEMTRAGKGRPSIHIPRCFSRIQLEITGVRVERLHSIGLRDAMDEGCEIRQISLFGSDQKGRDEIGRMHFGLLWESVNGEESWNANPWVWVVEFKRVAR